MDVPKDMADGAKGAQGAIEKALRRKTLNQRFVPKPMEMCRSTLIELTRKRLSHQALKAAVAKAFGVPLGLVKTKYPDDKGASFNQNFHIAMRHLQRNKLIKHDGKAFDVVLNQFGQTRPIPPMDIVAPPGEPDITCKWPVDIDWLQAELPLFSLGMLLEYSRFASEWYDSVKGFGAYKLGRQINAIAAKTHIFQEFVRRGILKESGAFIRWPSTDAPGGDGSLTLHYLEKEGPLAALGYHVGKGARGATQRCRLLTKAFLEDLPQIPGVEDWGGNDSSDRLKKMAESIAAFARNAKRRNSASWADAILMWEHDLEYLRVKHYVGRFDINWTYPASSI